MYTFEVFGKGAVICWPGTTSERQEVERAGKAVSTGVTALRRALVIRVGSKRDGLAGAFTSCLLAGGSGPANHRAFAKTSNVYIKTLRKPEP